MMKWAGEDRRESVGGACACVCAYTPVRVQKKLLSVLPSKVCVINDCPACGVTAHGSGTYERWDLVEGS